MTFDIDALLLDLSTSIILSGLLFMSNDSLGSLVVSHASLSCQGRHFFKAKYLLTLEYREHGSTISKKF